MDNAKHTGRVGALAVALGVGNVRRTATRMTVSIGAAALVVMATVVPAPTASASDEPPSPDTTALILCGTTCPTPDQFWVDSVMKQFIMPTHMPTHPGETITPVRVTAPMEFWPITGLFRLLGLALGPPSIWGPGGPGWPDEPLWKLSGLFDLTADKSLQAGVAGLEDAMANNPSDHLVIYGNSQGAGIANVVKHRLAEQYPGSDAPDIDFVLGGDPNLPNGGLVSRFPGLYIPIVDLTFNGPALTDTQFDTVEINRQYDGFSDFPLYPLNLISLANAVLGIVYVHMYGLDVSLPAEHPTESPAYQDKHGDTDYYFFENPDLPLFGPLRTLGVPERVIDVVEPFFRVLVELGYDRSIPAWEPTPARLIPPLDRASVAGDLVDAIGEGITNAAALIGGPPPLSIPAAPATADPNAVEEQVLSAPGTALKRVGRDVGDHINNTIGAVKSVIGNGRTIARSAGSDNDSPTASPTRKTPLRDAVTRARADVKKVVTHVSDNIKKALGGARDKPNTRPEGGAGATP